MIKDIHPPTVENIAVAVVNEKNELDESIWNVYLLNLKDIEIEGVLVNSTGYGVYNDEDVKTSTLRHFLDTMEAMNYKKIESMPENLFGLNNEYWVSFFVDNVMYDKKFVFLAETIKEDYYTMVPLLNKKGVMIR